MQAAIIVVVVLHVLTVVFWAGSTFTLTRMGSQGAEKLFGPQMGAATVAVLSGMALWGMLHKGPFGPAEQILAVGAAAGILAAGVQGALIGPVRGKIARGADADLLRPRMAIANRIAAGLLAIALVAMTAARFV